MRKTMLRWLIALAVLLPCLALTTFAAGVDLPTADAVSAGQYVLDRDVTLSGTLSVEGDVVIDLNGRTLNGMVAPYFTIGEGGKLTIKDSGGSGKIVGITAADYMVKILSGGEVVLESGTLTGHTNTEGTWDIGGAIYNGGTFTMTGGAITNNSAGENGHGGAIRVDRGSVTTISGGEISGNTARRGGAISTGDTAFQEDAPFPVINITGGTFTGNIATDRTPTIYVYMTNVTISGGVFDRGVRVGDAVNYPDGIWTRNGTTNICGGELEQLCVGVNRFMSPATMSLHITGNPVIREMDIAAGVEGLTATIGNLTSGAAVTTTGSENAFTALDDTVWVGNSGTAYLCAQDAEGRYPCGNNVFGTLKDGELTISGTGAMWEFRNNSDVPWYDVKDTIKTVTIGEGVTNIGSKSFNNCSALNEITIPDSVTEIGPYAFNGCNSLTEITIPDSVTTIGEGAFFSCRGLAEIAIPDGVTGIGYRTFYNCTALSEITIPDSVTEIGEAAFRECTGLTSVVIGDGVTEIGDVAFYNCPGLTTMEFLGNAPAEVGSDIFGACDDLNIYYHENATGWTDSEHYDAEAGTWCGRPLVMIKKPVQSTLGYFSLEVIKTIVVDGQQVNVCRWKWTPFAG